MLELEFVGYFLQINQLKEDKESLEKQLQKITEERDCLLNTLSDAQQTCALLQQENANQQLVVSSTFLMDCFYFKIVSDRFSAAYRNKWPTCLFSCAQLPNLVQKPSLSWIDR